MLRLAYDTETSGLPRKGARTSDPDFPFLVSLACVLVDENWRDLSVFSTIVRPPEGCLIDPLAAEIHGITTEQALKFGVPAEVAYRRFDRMARKAGQMIAHNESFDARILQATWIGQVIAPLKQSFQVVHGMRPRYCTADHATPVLNLTPTEAMKRWPNLANKPKRPTLGECAGFLFGEEHEDAHDALADVRMCLRVARRLQEIERDQAASSAVS